MQGRNTWAKSSAINVWQPRFTFNFKTLLNDKVLDDENEVPLKLKKCPDPVVILSTYNLQPLPVRVHFQDCSLKVDTGIYTFNKDCLVDGAMGHAILNWMHWRRDVGLTWRCKCQPTATPRAYLLSPPLLQIESTPIAQFAPDVFWNEDAYNR